MTVSRPQPEAMSRRSSLRTMALAAMALAVCLLQTGCVFRRMTVRSDPPGALVLVDGQEIGYTPCSMDFTYYGTREIKLVKDGYETLTVMQKLQAPWYQYPVVEFFADNLSPHKITNRHEFSYRLQPQAIVPTQELLDRANSLRSDTQVGP
ncbi:MAG: PEGA domain-containing protein [Planctomycetaceae bacterium]|nr:PEGA domain-containing protein [Planctomycetaceae bacterium]